MSLTAACIQSALVEAKCCTAELQARIIAKEKTGQKCQSETDLVIRRYEVIDMLWGYVPEGELLYSYTIGQTLSFDGATFIISSIYDPTVPAFYTMFGAGGANTVGAVLEFGSTTVTVTLADGTVITGLDYTYNATTRVLFVADFGYQDITFDKFYNIVASTPANDQGTSNFTWYGDKTLTGGTTVNVYAEKPCLTIGQVQTNLDWLKKNCPCNCEEYINTVPLDPPVNEAIVNLNATFGCFRGEHILNITFSYSGANTENAFTVIATDSEGNVTVLYEFDPTGETDGTVSTSVTVPELYTPPKTSGYYNVTVVDNYGTSTAITSNILTDLYQASCNT